MNYCTKCGSVIPVVGGWKQVGTYDALGKTLAIYGTSCCGAQSFSDYQIHWDYCDERPIKGERVESSNLSQLVKLCCAIGKSPRSIRKNLHFYYFDIASELHRDAYHKLVDKMLVEKV